MKLYQTIDGTMIGFYQERGGEVQAIMYRDVYETRTVTKTRDEQVWIESTFVSKSVYVPGFYDDRPIEIPGRWERRRVMIPAYEEEQLVEIPAFYERRHVQEPGRYEIQNIWIPEYYVTRYYWREAHPARGLEAAWIPYEHLIPAGLKEQRVWIEGEWRTKVFRVDATFEYQMVTVPAAWGSEEVWIEPISRMDKVWVPAAFRDVSTGEHGHFAWVEVEYTETENVWVGYEPVYSFIDETQVTLFEVLDLDVGAGTGPEFEDVITIRNRMNGEELTTTAKYRGYATKVDENEFVVPY